MKSFRNILNEYKKNSIKNYYKSKKKDRKYITLDNIPKYLLMLIISMEDIRFFQHKGFDILKTIKALCVNIKSRRVVTGGSTITQQLVKNVYLSQERTVKRKIIEYFLSRKVERELSKYEILELYINIIYYGNNQIGINNASQFYFNKIPSKLSINECITLGSILPNPYLYNPIERPDDFYRAKDKAIQSLQKHRHIFCNQDAEYFRYLPYDYSEEQKAEYRLKMSLLYDYELKEKRWRRKEYRSLDYLKLVYTELLFARKLRFFNLINYLIDKVSYYQLFESETILHKNRLNYLFPNGLPKNEKEARKNTITIYVPIVSENQHKTMKLRCHKKLAGSIFQSFVGMMMLNVPINRKQTVCFNYCYTSSEKISNHAYGTCIDISWNGIFAELETHNIVERDIENEIADIWKLHGFFEETEKEKDYIHMSYVHIC